VTSDGGSGCFLTHSGVGSAEKEAIGSADTRKFMELVSKMDELHDKGEQLLSAESGCPSMEHACGS
jgi:hypothetical protein